MVWAEAAVGLLTFVGVTLILDSRHRQRVDLAERLMPFQPPAIGDEAERWLKEQ